MFYSKQKPKEEYIYILYIKYL